MNGNERDNDRAASPGAGRDPHQTVPSAQHTWHDDPPAAPGAIGRYQIDRSLGTGGFGNVWLAYDTQLKRRVAVKVPHPHLISSAEDTAAFLAEAQVLASLDHPHIVPVYDVGSQADIPCYVVSKYVEGDTLEQRMQSVGYSYHDAACLTATIAEALHYAHTQGLVHRDVKPSNILLDASGVPSLADFGLALRESDVGRGPRYAGTPAYMSPEQARGEGHRVDGRSDIYSLGCIFFELLVGRRPFRATVPTEVMELIANHDPKPPRQIKDSVPRELERICLKALSRRASDRYTTAKDMAEDIRHFLAGQSTDTIAASAGLPPDNVAITDAPRPSSHRHPTPVESPLMRIVPRGLRSFDQRDAEFFLELVPGPRDRHGVPESIVFWKRHAEEMDEDRTFPVTLIYGPSGCGKSSLVKAGLLPRLDDFVTPVLIECTAHDTEERLLRSLRKQLPGVRAERSLPETMAAIRQGEGRGPDHKVLIILDQFEQWLHAQGDSERAELVQALRQCDGGRLQALLMIRDDFWMATTRLMQALEVPIQEGCNSASVDLFPLTHARRVLTAFGRAYGDLASSDVTLEKPQRQFVDQAVQSLAEDDKVVCVRLVLFAEMMKGKLWTPETLRRFGGPEGIGVAFLDETFDSRTAPPEHRYHERAARRLLEALLPEAGVGIRGQMRSRAELLEASGCQDRPRDFDDLLHILDNQLRLITPVDPIDASGQGDSPAELESPAAFYQLTHDFLVPPLRTWLTRKRRETRRGRAELCLEQRAAEWAVRPEHRQLPRWWEALSIRLWTDTSRWTDTQRKMMRRSARVYGFRTILLLVLLGVFLTAAWMIRSSLEDRRQRNYAESMVRSLVIAEISNVPGIVDKLNQYREWAVAPLQEAHRQAAEDSPARLRTTLALLNADDTHVDYLYSHMLSAQPADLRILIAALQPHRHLLEDRLWDTLYSEEASHDAKLRAASALAAYQPSSERWEQASETVTEQLVKVPLAFLTEWQEALRGISRHLLDPLEDIFVDADRGELERNVAASILSAYTADDLPRAVHLLCLAEEHQFDVLCPLLETDPVAAARLLELVLKEELRPEWKDPPPDASWAPLDTAATDTLKVAHGLVADGFALCLTLPFDQWETTVNALTTSGFRPIRFRPYAIGTGILVAAVWIRDGARWTWATASTPSEFLTLDARLREQQLVPVDASYFRDPTAEDLTQMRIVGLWGPGELEDSDLQFCIGQEGPEFNDQVNEQIKKGLNCQTVSAASSRDGTLHRCQLYARIGPEFTNRLLASSWREMQLQPYPGRLLCDLTLFPWKLVVGTKSKLQEELAAAESAVQDQPDDRAARLQRADLFARLGDYQSAMADMEVLSKSTDPEDAAVLQRRYLLHAALQNTSAARHDLELLRTLEFEPTHLALLEMIAGAHFGDDASAQEQLEDAIAQDKGNPSTLYIAARAYSQASEIWRSRNERKSEQYARRAISLLREIGELGDGATENWITTADFAPLYEDAAFLKLCADKRLLHRYVGVWNPSADYSGRFILETDPAQLVERGNELIADGYRPVACSVSETASRQLEMTSVWHRPNISEPAQESLARRQANAAVALLKLGQAEHVWPLFREQSERRLRSYLIHKIGRHAIEPSVLARRLETEQDTSARRAILLALASLQPSSLPSHMRPQVVSSLLHMLEEDGDAGVHGAADLTLRRWGETEAVEAITSRLATGRQEGGRSWYANGQGQTMVVLGPVDRFLMGSPPFEEGRRNGFEESHYRQINRRFAIATCEVTNDQFERYLIRDGRYRPKEHLPNRPVRYVNWYEAAGYCNWLSEQEGIDPHQWCYLPNEAGQYAAGMRPAPDILERSGYRLPTEPEWEYAARAGTQTARYFGQSITLLPDYAHYLRAVSGDELMPVASLLPNDFGLFDMYGNLFEWCQNEFGAYHIDPSAAVPDEVDLQTVTDGHYRSLRGGSYLEQDIRVRSAFRARYYVSSTVANVGFRVARTIK